MGAGEERRERERKEVERKACEVFFLPYPTQAGTQRGWGGGGGEGGKKKGRERDKTEQDTGHTISNLSQCFFFSMP